jgi:hypothetical protein
MRHAQRFHVGTGEERHWFHRSLTMKGVTETRGVGERFKDFLEQSLHAPSRVTVFDVGTEASHETANVLKDAIGSRAVRAETPLEDLSPEIVTTYDGDFDRRLAPRLTDALRRHSEPLIIVGDDPQTSWMANAGLRRSSIPFALRSSELVWRQRPEPQGPRWEHDRPYRRNVTLDWVFSPSDEKSTTLIRAKIESKMNSAKVLGTFLTALFALAAREVLGNEDDRDVNLALSVAGLSCLALSIILFFVALYRYDSLLMPSRFWGGATSGRRRRHVRRPPASDVWVLAESMVRIWNRNFTWAVGFAGVGVVTLVVAVAEPDGRGWVIAALVVGATGIALFAWMFARWSKPTLGSND